MVGTVCGKKEEGGYSLGVFGEVLSDGRTSGDVDVPLAEMGSLRQGTGDVALAGMGSWRLTLGEKR